MQSKLAAFFSHPLNWDQVSDADKDYIRTLLPPHAELNDDGSIPAAFWKYNPEFRLDCRNLQDDLRAGRMDPEWQRQAAQAMEERAAGEFDNFKEKEFEEFWGQKQKVDWTALAGHASKVRLEELLKSGLFKVGDAWCFNHTFGRGSEAFRVEKECKVLSIERESITLAIPPGRLKFARRLAPDTSSINGKTTGEHSSTVQPETGATNGEEAYRKNAAVKDDGLDKEQPTSVPEANGPFIKGEPISADSATPIEVRAEKEEPATAEQTSYTTVFANTRPQTPVAEPVPQLLDQLSTGSSELSEPPPDSDAFTEPAEPVTSEPPDALAAATEYDIILYTTTGLHDLEKKILQIDGRAKPGSRTDSTWRRIRCRRDNQDVGSLFEMRDEYYANKVAKGNYGVERRSK